MDDLSEVTMDAQWCWDSETGKRVLIDRKTGQILYTWTKTEDKTDGT
jgi:hypothetical protein